MPSISWAAGPSKRHLQSVTLLLVTGLLLCGPLWAETVSRDTDGDGRVDQIAQLDPKGRLSRLALD
ncbi:MAG: hypothetical protein P8Z73_03270, partial [Desulfobacteraceae bacterium]